MKVLLINDCDYYLYPDSSMTLEDFVKFANTHMGRLVPLVMLKEEKCTHPFYIEEEKQLYYLNPSRIETVTEAEVTVLSRKEYNKRLEILMNEVCINCACYEEDQENNFEGVREKMCLDGQCWDFESLEHEDNDQF